MRLECHTVLNFSFQFCQIRTFPPRSRFVNIPKSVQRDARGETQTGRLGASPSRMQ